jgi:hypothetical protein
MLRTVQFTCTLSKDEADALHAESGRRYSDMLACHYRRCRRQCVWLRPELGERWEDRHGGPPTLHAHRRAAAQQGFYTACKIAQACQQAGLDTNYPYHRTRWRTTVWKASGIRLQDGALCLARARGLAPVVVSLPPPLAHAVAGCLPSGTAGTAGVGPGGTTRHVAAVRPMEQLVGGKHEPLGTDNGHQFAWPPASVPAVQR